MTNNKEHNECRMNNENHNHSDNSHQHNEYHNSKSSALPLAFWLNFLFSIIEVIGGLLTNSTAIIADAYHDFMDAISIGIAIMLEKISGKKRTAKFSYGYKRFSMISALVLSVFLLIGAVGMIISAYNSFVTPKEVNSIGMLWLAVLGLAVNGFAFIRIKNGDGHSHHGHNHGHTHTNDEHNHNSRSIMLHLLEDVLGWAAVLVGALVIYLTGWNWIDGVLAIGIALFVGYNATKNLLTTAKVMLQSVPENVNIEQLTNELNQIEGIENIHDVHVWSLDGRYNVGSLHAVVNASGENVMDKIVKLMKTHKIQHPTVQIESINSVCELANC